MKWLPGSLYSLSTDNTYILAVPFTDKEKFFLAGKDNCLYEVAYQAEDCFSQRCRKLNHSKSSVSFFGPSLLQFIYSKDDPIVEIVVDNLIIDNSRILCTQFEKRVITDV